MKRKGWSGTGMAGKAWREAAGQCWAIQAGLDRRGREGHGEARDGSAGEDRHDQVRRGMSGNGRERRVVARQANTYKPAELQRFQHVAALRRPLAHFFANWMASKRMTYTTNDIGRLGDGGIYVGGYKARRRGTDNNGATIDGAYDHRCYCWRGATASNQAGCRCTANRRNQAD